MRAKDQLGRLGENLATAYLEERGHDVVERNWRCWEGEIDVVSKQGGYIVFTEVKARRSTAAGHPLEAITPTKLARMRRLAGLWMLAHPDERGAMRLDVIAVIAPNDRTPVVEHVAGVGA